MFTFSVKSDDLDSIVDEIHHLENAVSNLETLGGSVAIVMSQENMAARMLGVDKDGDVVAPLKQSTIDATPYRINMTPLIPMETESRVISAFETEVVRVGYGAVDVIGGWPSVEWMIYHITGTANMAARNPCGITPIGWAHIEMTVDEWFSGLAGMRYG